MNPWEDKNVVSSFIDDEWNHVVEWCEDRNLNPENLDNQLAYCMFYEHAFLEYAAEFEHD